MKNEDLREENAKLKRLMDAAGLGWWEADFENRTYYISDYMIRLFGFESNAVSFEDFLTVIREDYRTRIANEFESIRFKDAYDQTFPVYTVDGVEWIRARVIAKETGADGNLLTMGIAQCVAGKEDPCEQAIQRMNNLVYQQNNISGALLSFLQIEDISDVIERALGDILAQFGGGRVYLFEYDRSAGTQTCTYEVTDQKVSRKRYRFQKSPLYENSWWTRRIVSGLPIILNDLDELPPEAAAERQSLEDQHVKSLLAIPLVSRDAVWGFVGIDTVAEGRTWTNEDYQWFSSIVNIISVCMQLHESEMKIRRDKQDLENLYRYMPTGYLRMRMIYENGTPVDYILMDANEAAGQITGFPFERLRGKRGRELEMPIADHLPRLGKVVNTDGYYHTDFYLSGHDRYCRAVIYSPLKDEVVVLISDVTDSVQAHKALETSGALLQNIYKNLPVGIELYDANGTMIDINDKELDIFGLQSKEDALGINMFENPNLPPELIEKLRRHEDVDFSLNYDFSKVTGYYHTRNNDKIYLVTKVTCLYDADGTFRNYLFINIDNTETTNAYSKIQEFEDLFLLVGKYARVGYAHFNGCTREGYALSSWYENVGEIPGTPLPQVIGCYDHFHPDDLVTMRGFFRQVVAGEIRHFTLDARILRPGGDYSWTRINVVVKNYRPEENNIEMVCVNYDITTLKNTEKKLMEARDRAETSDRLKSAFLANMSHEIRTPLNAIVGFSNLLVDTEDREERREQMKIVQENNELLLQLISDILDLSKIEAGTFDFTEGDVDVRELCSEIVRSLSIRTPEGVRLVFDERSPQIALRGDKSRITQVITNFITNALKFTHEGTVQLGYDLCGDSVRFRVSDTGIGIPADKIDSVFDRFTKLNSFAQGTGLGLSICKSLVEQMEGHIGVESELGKGSCFWFTHPYRAVAVPAARDVLETTAEDVSGRAEGATAGPPLILVAEDIDSNYLLISSILRKKYRLVRARNGAEAVRLFGEERPDLVLMDIKMPVMDGIEATRLIRTGDSGVPVIAVTAFAFDQDRQHALEAGCNDYISKPVSVTALEIALRKWLGSSE